MKKIKSGDFIDHRDWNDVVAYLRGQAFEKYDPFRRQEPVFIETDTEIEPYSIFGFKFDSTVVGDKYPLTLQKGNDYHYLTNGHLRIKKKGWAIFVNEPCLISLYDESDAPSVGAHCGPYQGKIHKNFTGFICLGIDNGKAWVMKSNDLIMTAKTNSGISAFKNKILGTGSAGGLFRDNGQKKLKGGRSMTVYSLTDRALPTGDYLKVAPVDKVGMVVMPVCLEEAGTSLGGSAGPGDCVESMTLLTDLSALPGQSVHYVEADYIDVRYSRLQRCLQILDEYSDRFEICCEEKLCECDDLPDIMYIKGVVRDGDFYGSIRGILTGSDCLGSTGTSQRLIAFEGGEVADQYTYDGYVERNDRNGVPTWEHKVQPIILGERLGLNTFNPIYFDDPFIHQCSSGTDSIFMSAVAQSQECPCRPLEGYTGGLHDPFNRFTPDSASYFPAFIFSETGQFIRHVPFVEYFRDDYFYDVELPDPLCLDASPFRKISISYDGQTHTGTTLWSGNQDEFKNQRGNWNVNWAAGLGGDSHPTFNIFGGIGGGLACANAWYASVEPREDGLRISANISIVGCVWRGCTNLIQGNEFWWGVGHRWRYNGSVTIPGRYWEGGSASLSLPKVYWDSVAGQRPDPFNIFPDPLSVSVNVEVGF